MQRREMLGTVMGALGAVGVMGAGMGDARAATQWTVASSSRPNGVSNKFANLPMR